MAFADTATAASTEAVSGIARRPFWLDDADRPQPVEGELPATCDLLIVGGGFTGLWTAIIAKERDPSRTVVLVEGSRIGEGASGRNGGFVSASLTHGLMNGAERWPEELPELLRMGHRNLDEIEEFVSDHGIDCDFERTGEIDIAVQEHEVAGLIDFAKTAQAVGEPLEFLDRQQLRAYVASPMALAGVRDSAGNAVVNPARLAWGLARVARDAGVLISERTPVEHVIKAGSGIDVHTNRGVVRAARVALATNAYPPLLRRMRHMIAPVYDYVLVTQPIPKPAWEAIGWAGREGLSDAGNRFHYFRIVGKDRILWGGYDAVHHRSPEFSRSYETDTSHLPRLAQHFYEFFPALEGIPFSHGWGGAIDTCSRFTPFWGTAMAGRLGYCLGYTGLGVGSSRFGAMTMLDLLDGERTERTELTMVKTKPIPFPPEPFKSAGIALTTRSIEKADRSGRRDYWLRLLDSLGMGFDS